MKRKRVWKRHWKQDDFDPNKVNGLARKLAKEEAEWAAKSGPVTVSHVDSYPQALSTGEK